MDEIKQLDGYSVKGNMLIHFLVKYYDGRKLDIFYWVPISVATMLDKYNKSIGTYKPKEEYSCRCGYSQCSGCGYNFRSIRLIKVIRKKTKLKIIGNFPDKIIKNWLEHISYNYEYNVETDLLEEL